MNNNELAHHGIIGMKWGVRRYQNADGSLTPAGQKRYNKEMEKAKAEEATLKNREKTQAKLAKLDNLKKSNEARRKKLDGEVDDEDDKKKKSSKEEPDSKSETKQKSVKEMTNEELIAETTRLRLEKAYLNELPEEPVSKGKEFIKEALSKQVIPALTEVGKNALNKAVDAALKKAIAGEVDLDKIVKSGSAEEISKYLGKYSNEQLKNASSRMAYERTIKEAAAAEKAQKEAKASAEKEAKQAAKAQKEAKASAEKEAKQAAKAQKEAEKEADQAAKKTKQESKTSDETINIDLNDYIGSIKYTSNNSSSASSGSSTSKSSWKSNTVEGVEYTVEYDTPISSVPAVYTNRGENYIRRLLNG